MKIFEYAAKTRTELLSRNLLQMDLWKILASTFDIKEDTPEYVDGFRKFAEYFNKFREEFGVDMDEQDLDNRYILKTIKKSVFEQ